MSGGGNRLPREVTSEARLSPHPNWWKPFTGFVFCLIFPTVALLKDAGGLYLLFLYGVVTIVALYLSFTRFVPISGELLTRRIAALALVLGFSLLLGLYLYIHPQIDTDGFRLFGISVGASDADDAIDVALRELLNGHYPYYTKTFLGNPLTPMPGTLLLAVPFYVIGDSALQNIFWLGAFSMLVAWHYRDIRVAALVTVLVLLLSPDVIYNVFQGSDYISNSIYVLVFLVLLIRSAQRSGVSKGSLLWAAFLGLGLSSRPIFLFVIPVVFFNLKKTCGARSAYILVGVALSAFLSITVPFVVYDPYGFSPLHTSNFLSQRGAFPWAPIIIPVVTGILSVALGLSQENRTIEGAVFYCFLVQLFLIANGVVLASLAQHNVASHILHVTLLFVFFGVFVFGPASMIQSGTLTSERA